MWLHVDVDRIERFFTIFTDSRPSLRSSRRSRFLFPSSRTPITDLIDMQAVTRRAFLFLLSITASYGVFIFLMLTAIAATILYPYRHRIHHFHWHLLRLLYRIALNIFLGRSPPMQFITSILVFSTLGFAWLLAVRWAWNRRAKRLNFEATLPQPVLVSALDVWPPPPTVSTPADFLPKK